MIGLDLYWIPLGAGGNVVRFCGTAYEWVVAARDRRPRLRLYHAALVAVTPTGRFTIESAPALAADAASRGVTGGGAVGSTLLGRSRLFRYELRCWRDGVIPDLDAAVGGARRLTEDPETTTAVLRLMTMVPTPVWGRDEFRLGEMWNSNSMVSWLLVRAGLEVAGIDPPDGGRAPGWCAGIRAARIGLERTSARASRPGSR